MILVVVLLCGLAASCFVIGRRARVEAANNVVEIVVDYGEVEQIAASTGGSLAHVLKAFKAAGATSVAVTEQTVGDLIDARKIIPYGERQFALEPSIAERVALRLQTALANGRSRVRMTLLPSSGTCYMTVAKDVPPTYLEQIPVGLPDDAIAAARSAGLGVTARLLNYAGARPEAINATLDYLAAKGIGKIIFQGEQVLGFKGGVKYTADAMKRTGVVFGRVEFAKQKGEIELAQDAPANVVIVHSIPQNEMPGLDVGSIVERFQRAVKERGVRVCYVRMYDTSSRNLLASNAEYLAKISGAIYNAGFALGECRPIEDVSAPRVFTLLAAAGAAAGALLLLFAVFNLSWTASVIWIVGAIAACVGLGAVGDLGRNGVALIAALAFPTLGVICAVRQSPDTPTTVTGVAFKALGRTLSAAIITAVGGAIIVGLMSEQSYMLRTRIFLGVRAAQVLPILALAVLFAGGLAWKSDTWEQQKRRFVEKFREIAASPMLMWQAGLALALLVILGLMVARSGNEPGVGVSEYELKFRALLDKLLYVRPRTKEFLIGYPALLVGIAFALRGIRKVAAPLAVVGSIALVSEINSFCHVHTPLVVSSLRAVNGAVVGCILGLIIYAFVKGRDPGERTEGG